MKAEKVLEKMKTEFAYLRIGSPLNLRSHHYGSDDGYSAGMNVNLNADKSISKSNKALLR